MSKLKPCPFCGGESRLLLNAKRKIYGKDEYRTGVVACCNVCEARMFYGSEKLAIEAWNRRTRPERKNGRWIPVDSFSAFGGDEAMWMAHGNPVAFYYCSECKEQAYAGEDGESLLTDFCPSCGADMRGESE